MNNKAEYKSGVLICGRTGPDDFNYRYYVWRGNLNGCLTVGTSEQSDGRQILPSWLQMS